MSTAPPLANTSNQQPLYSLPPSLPPSGFVSSVNGLSLSLELKLPWKHADERVHLGSSMLQSFVFRDWQGLQSLTLFGEPGLGLELLG